jgi:2-keto-3-deoxy-6-phosphogluconate aldolase
VDASNAAAFMAAGAFGVGFVGNLFLADDLAHARFAAIRERATAMVAAVRGVPRL